MSYIQRSSVAVTTSAGGSFTGNSAFLTGKLLAVLITVPGAGGITAAAITITNATTGETILSLTGVSASANYYPRSETHSPTGTSEGYVGQFGLYDDQLQVAITGGGSGTTATISFVLE